MCGGGGRRARVRAERPMDEEDAAAPVGGDRGRGPRDPGSPPGLRREAGGEGGAWRSCLEAYPVGTLAPCQAWGDWAASH